MHISCVSWKATDSVSHQPGTLWVTEGLTVPLATTSLFSKVKKLSSSHPVARQWMIRLGHSAVRSGCGRNYRDAVYIKPTRERKTRWMLVVNWRAIIYSFRKIRKRDPMPKAELAQIPGSWYISDINQLHLSKEKKKQQQQMRRVSCQR